MTLAVILVIFAALALVVFSASRCRAACRFLKRSGVAARIQPVDVEAFRNLVNPAEDEHLRRRLPPAEFRQFAASASAPPLPTSGLPDATPRFS